MKARCVLCGMTANPDPIFIWHFKKFIAKTARGKEVERTLWLCPECCSEFKTAKERDRFLEGQMKGVRGA
jgi:hypothetical protein